RLKLKQLFLHLKVSLSTKKKTHYEILGISPGATYSEIKTAYYDLTLKYHPDKNKSDSAKAMFQEISNSYDVLSKYESRKNYDRMLKIEQDVKYERSQVKDVKKYKPRDPIEYATSRLEIYNFDEWMRHHYKESFRRHKKAQDKMSDLKKESMETNRGGLKAAIYTFIISMLIAAIGYSYRTVAESEKPTLNVKPEK
ncbi:dnaJ homolog subfamily C member 30-like, partial [Ceratina calcarata]